MLADSKVEIELQKIVAEQAATIRELRARVEQATATGNQVAQIGDASKMAASKADKAAKVAISAHLDTSAQLKATSDIALEAVAKASEAAELGRQNAETLKRNTEQAQTMALAINEMVKVTAIGRRLHAAELMMLLFQFGIIWIFRARRA